MLAFVKSIAASRFQLFVLDELVLASPRYQMKIWIIPPLARFSSSNSAGAASQQPIGGCVWKFENSIEGTVGQVPTFCP